MTLTAEKRARLTRAMSWDGKPLGRNKKAILDRIAKLALLNDDNGELVLCRHEVIFDDAYAAQRAAGFTGGKEPASE